MEMQAIPSFRLSSLSLHSSQHALPQPARAFVLEQAAQAQAQMQEMPVERITTVEEGADMVSSATIAAIDMTNVKRWQVLLGMLVGFGVATVLVQSGVDLEMIKPSIDLCSDLFVNAMLCVIVPSIFCNVLVASMHFCSLNKAKPLWWKMVGYFVATTLLASVLSTLLAVGAMPLVTSARIASDSVIATSTPAVHLAFRCESTGLPMTVLANGLMVCSSSSNGTLFQLQDIAHSFQVQNATNSSTSLASIVLNSVEALSPINAIDSFVRGDVLHVILIAVLVGMALTQIASFQSMESTATTFGSLVCLIVQAESILSVMLRGLLYVLPIGIAMLTARTVIAASTHFDGAMQPCDIWMLALVLLVALAVHSLVVLLFVRMVAKVHTPIRFLQRLLPAQLVAMGTSSTLLALPITIRSIAATQQVTLPLAHLVCTAGTMLHRNGNAIFLAISCVYIHHTTQGPNGAAIGAVHLAIALTSALCAFVVPNGPQGHAIVLGALASSVLGLDRETIALVLVGITALDCIGAPLVAAFNVTNDALVALSLAPAMQEALPSWGAVPLQYDANAIVGDDAEGQI